VDGFNEPSLSSKERLKLSNMNAFQASCQSLVPERSEFPIWKSPAPSAVFVKNVCDLSKNALLTARILPKFKMPLFLSTPQSPIIKACHL
jgi:hypothetical protein